jgi:hypothetical protein
MPLVALHVIANTFILNQAYVSGNAIVLLDSPNNVLQTTYVELPDELLAIVIDEISGKIAACSESLVHVYKPDGYYQGSPRVN